MYSFPCLPYGEHIILSLAFSIYALTFLAVPGFGLFLSPEFSAAVSPYLLIARSKRRIVLVEEQLHHKLDSRAKAIGKLAIVIPLINAQIQCKAFLK